MNRYAEGMVAFAHGDFQKAAALFTAAITEGDNVALALSKLGVCRLKWGDREGAERDLRNALAADERCISAMVNLGNLMLERGELKEAQVCYERALRLDETYAFAHYNLGVLHRKRGDLAASIRELRLAAKYEAKPGAKKRLQWRKKGL
jgi:tetratricopeptide (TPR) repeat protein